MPAKKILDYLNPAQREAVQNTDGPVLVVAGAGSGKTRVLTFRIAYLIGEMGVKPFNILAVTFTNKAAKEMKERIEKLVGPASRQIWAGTFHSICARILRSHGQEIGLPRDFSIFDDGDQMALITECIEQMGLPEKKYRARPVLSMISTAKERLVSPDEFPSRFQGEFEAVVGRIYKEYENKLRQNSALDFDDLIAWTVKLLRENAEVRSYYQEKFHYVLVDEYQDINFAQYSFIKLVAGGRRNICCVGDDDQSIYRWRGADVGLILQFEIDYPNAKIFKLEQNYRSTKTILEAAHEIVSRNRSRLDKELWTDNAHGQAINIYEAANEQEEAIHVANVIQNKVAAEGRRYSDFVVLYRINAQSRVFEDTFLAHRVPYVLVGALRFYERREIKDVLAYLRLALNPYETVSLKRVINTPPRGVGPSTLARIEQFAADQDIPLWETVKRAQEISGIPKKASREIHTFIKLIEFLHDKRET
ncbi:MAG: UvrD-helicase domain-containing protein, partial [Armatimonadetes bacterium]|nr:UvrD-helicase domain-containing protein [Armatimonadota bacterium]